MRAISLLIFAILLWAASPACAAELLILQSMRDASFDEVLKGFRSKCGESARTVVLSDYAEVDVVRMVREEQPALIVTLGESALSSVRKVRGTPVVSLMSLALSMGHTPQANVTGVGMVASPEQYMQLFANMKVKKVGLLYNPARSGAYLARARRAAEDADIELVAETVREPHETPKKLSSLKGRVDSFWLIPDIMVIAPATVESYFLFSMDQFKPVVGYAASFLSMGAAAVLDIDRVKMGQQGGEIANRLLKGASPREIPFQEPRAVLRKKNESVTKKLGVHVD